MIIGLCTNLFNKTRRIYSIRQKRGNGGGDAIHVHYCTFLFELCNGTSTAYFINVIGLFGQRNYIVVRCVLRTIRITEYNLVQTVKLN